MNFAWAAAVAVFFGLQLSVDPTPDDRLRMLFWGIYFGAAIGLFVQLRVAWVITICQLLLIWTLMGVAVSDHSFSFFVGHGAVEGVDRRIDATVFNTFWGILAPVSALIMMLVFTHRDVWWILTRKPLPGHQAPRPWSLWRRR